MTEKKVYPPDAGAIWKKQSKKDGSEYLSLTVEGKRYVAFPNKQKRADNHPDYRIIESEPMPARAEATGKPENPEDAYEEMPF